MDRPSTSRFLVCRAVLRHFFTPAVALAAALCLTLPAPAGAWGPTGHRAVARIAESHLAPRAALEVRELLGRHTLPMVSTWADEMRSFDDYDYAETWHYVSIEDGETYEASTKNDDGDVIRTIREQSAILADRSRPAGERAEALKWLVHFVGDVHQPLHVGRAGDRGGNDVRVEWFGSRTNLHAVWDYKMVLHMELSFSELAEFLDLATLEEVRQWQDSDVLDWARESRALRPDVYAIGDGELKWDYLAVHRPNVERRVLQAGIRLAGLLNHLLGETQPAETP